MPHSISFVRPHESTADLRARFHLPADKFIFLSLFDLNSYAERKNPRAVVEAYRASGLAGSNAMLVIKVQNVANNPADFARLHAVTSELPGIKLITDTLPRADIYALEAACDCFVSLHRAEGFGLAVAEAMWKGKPVVGSEAGGIPEQVLFEVTGYTVGSVEGAAFRIRQLLQSPDLSARLGGAGREYVRRNFLLPRHLGDYLALLAQMTA